MHLPANDSILPLRASQVDVWLTLLSSVTDVKKASYIRVLSDDEVERWGRFVVESARTQFLVARALLRTSLSRYTGVPASVWQFEKNSFGRPHVAEPSAFRHIRFNISHTDGLVACAFTRNRAVGIDVERIERDTDLVALARHVFSPQEMAEFERHTPESQYLRFYTYWTLKEAYIKARGMGLSLALDGFWFNLQGQFPSVNFNSKCPDNPRRWHFRQFMPTSLHKLAVAFAAADADCDISLHWTVPTIEPANGT
ncbi:4'-phosphopantetheinyl transferase superfamily protein [Rhizobium leguminosarum]|uniref:4'-phosphopantetheinyl transferase family protein n=1 Tax=Rhizobium leguminosarum TaxID=384 RepID=UPI003ED05099